MALSLSRFDGLFGYALSHLSLLCLDYKLFSGILGWDNIRLPWDIESILKIFLPITDSFAMLTLSQLSLFYLDYRDGLLGLGQQTAAYGHSTHSQSFSLRGLVVVHTLSLSASKANSGWLRAFFSLQLKALWRFESVREELVRPRKRALLPLKLSPTQIKYYYLC